MVLKRTPVANGWRSPPRCWAGCSTASKWACFRSSGQKRSTSCSPSQGAANTTVNGWFAVIMAMFLIGAATGGVVFGWLGDRVGRVRAMSLSIFTYAVFTGLCGFATQAWHIAVLRFIASLGMGGEWALGVALVTEMWPDRSRAFLAGLIGAAANVGYLLVGLISLVAVELHRRASASLLLDFGMSQGVVDTLLRNDGWRLMMIVGAVPALLVFFIMLLVPESHKWEAERDKGATSHWATRDLLGVLLGAIGAAAVVFLWSPVFDDVVRGHAAGDAATSVLPLWAKLVRIAGSAVGLVVALDRLSLSRDALPGASRAGGRAGCGRSWPLHSSFVARRRLGECCAVGHLGLGAVGAEVGDFARQIAAGRGRPYTPRSTRKSTWRSARSWARSPRRSPAIGWAAA